MTGADREPCFLCSFRGRQRLLSPVGAVPALTPWSGAKVETPLTNCKKKEGRPIRNHWISNGNITLRNPHVAQHISARRASLTDLSPEKIPAGNNFPDLLYLMPMTTARVPEATERQKQCWLVAGYSNQFSVVNVFNSIQFNSIQFNSICIAKPNSSHNEQHSLTGRNL